MAQDVRPLESKERVSYANQFRILERELRTLYAVKWYRKADFMQLPLYRRKVELIHMTERLKVELLKCYAGFIKRYNVRFADGCTYWQWKQHLGEIANKKGQVAWRGRSTRPRAGNNYQTESPRPPAATVQRPRSLSWRGGP
jgi:hypothetical protein